MNGARDKWVNAVAFSFWWNVVSDRMLLHQSCVTSDVAVPMGGCCGVYIFLYLPARVMFFCATLSKGCHKYGHWERARCERWARVQHVTNTTIGSLYIGSLYCKSYFIAHPLLEGQNASVRRVMSVILKPGNWVYIASASSGSMRLHSMTGDVAVSWSLPALPVLLKNKGGGDKRW